MRLDPDNAADIDTVNADPLVSEITTGADYQADISRDGGRTWEADPMVPATVCGGHVQIEVSGALFAGAAVTAIGPVRTLVNDDGTLTRWTPTR